VTGVQTCALPILLAVLDGLEHQFLGDGVAADQLDDHVDLGVGDQLEYVGGNGGTGGVALRVGVTGGNLRNLNGAPGAPGDLLCVAFEYIEGTATDGAQPTDAYFHRFHA